MPIVLKEGRVTFSFQVKAASRWDGHQAFIRGVQRLQNTAAVDFLLRLDDDTLVLFEVKDLRGYRIENRNRDFAEEVSCKVRDSLAGMLWAARREHDTDVSAFTKLITRRDTPKTLVVLWLDEDHSDPAAAAGLQSELREALRLQVGIVARQAGG